MTRKSLVGRKSKVLSRLAVFAEVLLTFSPTMGLGR